MTADAVGDAFGHPLPALPPHPADVPWPTEEWPAGVIPEDIDLDPLLDEVMTDTDRVGRTRATVVVHRGRLIAERYGDRTDAWGDVTGDPVDRDTPLISWSMAKSMLHAVVGMLVADGLLDVDAPAAVPAWQDDDRAAITLDQLLCMRDGLDFVEDYDPQGGSDVVDMLFGSGIDDVAGYAIARPTTAGPGERFNYSSGTSNVVSSIVRDVLGGADEYRRFLHERLFEPIGMSSADPRFDEAGTWVASSYVWATARDMARFGELYLRDGVWDGLRLLPHGWVDLARTAQAIDPDDGRFYGRHWWVTGDDHGTFWANGYEGQSIMISPALDLVVVRLGKSAKEQYDALADWRARIVDAFAAAR